MLSDPKASSLIPIEALKELTDWGLVALAVRRFTRVVPIYEFSSEDIAMREAAAFLQKSLAQQSTDGNELLKQIRVTNNVLIASSQVLKEEGRDMNYAEASAAQSGNAAVGALQFALTKDANVRQAAWTAVVCSLYAQFFLLRAWKYDPPISTWWRNEMERIVMMMAKSTGYLETNLEITPDNAEVLAERHLEQVFTDINALHQFTNETSYQIVQIPRRKRMYLTKFYPADLGGDGKFPTFEIRDREQVRYHGPTSVHPGYIVKSLIDLARLLDVVNNDGFIWMRGEPRDYGSTALCPGAFRSPGAKEESVSQDLHRQFEEYTQPSRRDRQLVKLAINQHYGGVTRLLDWTDNQLAAVFFAANSDNQKSGFIFCLNPDRLKEIANISGDNGEIDEDVTLRCSFSSAHPLQNMLKIVDDNPGLTQLKEELAIINKGVDEEITTIQIKSENLIEHYLTGDSDLEGITQLALLGLPFPITLKRNFPNLEAQRGYFTYHPGYAGEVSQVPNAIDILDLCLIIKVSGSVWKSNAVRLLMSQDLLQVIEITPDFKKEFRKRYKLKDLRKSFFPNLEEWSNPLRGDRPPILATGNYEVRRNAEEEYWETIVSE